MEFKNKLIVVVLSAALLSTSGVFAAEQPSRTRVVARATAAAALAVYAAGTYFYNEGSVAGNAVAGTALATAAAVVPVSLTDTAKAVFNWVTGKIAAYKIGEEALPEALPLVRTNGLFDCSPLKELPGATPMTALTEAVFSNSGVTFTSLYHAGNPIYSITGRIDGAKYFARQADGNVYPLNDRDVQ